MAMGTRPPAGQHPQVLPVSGIGPETLAGLRPDLIVVVSAGLTEEDHDLCSRIPPGLAQPPGAAGRTAVTGLPGHDRLEAVQGRRPVTFETRSRQRSRSRASWACGRSPRRSRQSSAARWPGRRRPRLRRCTGRTGLPGVLTCADAKTDPPLKPPGSARVTFSSSPERGARSPGSQRPASGPGGA